MEYSDIATNLLSLGKRNRIKPRRFRETEENRENGELGEPARRPDDTYFGDGVDGDDDSDGSYEEPEDDKTRIQNDPISNNHQNHQNHAPSEPALVNGDSKKSEAPAPKAPTEGGYGGEVESIEGESEDEDQHDQDHDPAAHSDASDQDHDSWTCNVCGRSFNSSKGLKVHKSWRHPDPGQAPHLPHHATQSSQHHHSLPSPFGNPKKRKLPRAAPEPKHVEPEEEVDELAVIAQLANLQRQRAKLLAQRELPQLAPDSPPKKVKKEPEEKRLARWRDKPSQAVRDRIERAVSQRMYLISRSDKSEHEKEFTVLGSVGNVYTVNVSHKPRCSCPDFEKGNLCKHILFVLLKVLRLPPDSQLIYQVALLTHELTEIFSKAPANPTHAVMASHSVQRKYQELTNSNGHANGHGPEKRKPAEGDCPICYEEMTTKEPLVWCELGCGNNVHAACFQQWSLTKSRNGEEISCVYCRAPWKSNPSSKPHTNSDGYINLANLQPGMSTERDWYAYPKRGMSWYW